MHAPSRPRRRCSRRRRSSTRRSLNLSYTKIVAPEAGIITRKSVEINQNVSPGQNLLTLVSLEGLWVTANFKETQLKHMDRKPASRDIG